MSDIESQHSELSHSNVQNRTGAKMKDN
jgi:hypothetical protein